MYIVVFPLSGVVHLLRLKDATRGFYDVMSLNGIVAGDILLIAVPLTYIGLVCLWLGAMFVKPVASPSQASVVAESRVVFSPATWVVMGVVLSVPALWAVTQATALSESVDATRVWGFDGGNARIAFLASWFPWGVSFLAIGIAFYSRAIWLKLVILVAAAAAIYYANLWSGGRSLSLLYAFPIICLIFPALKKARAFVTLGGIAAIIYVVVQGSLQRTATFAVQQVNLGGIVDWEWGRFSMTAFAAAFVRENGLLYGETYLKTLADAPVAVANLFGAHLVVPMRTISQVTAQQLLGDVSLNYTVPGALAEAYMNIGIFGAISIFLLLGFLAAQLQRVLDINTGPAVRMLVFYWVGLLLFRGFVAESISFATYVLFTGLPLITVALIERVGSRRRFRDNPISDASLMDGVRSEVR